MNYIAVFAFKIFEKDVDKTYRFLSFLSKFYLKKKFKGDLEGLEEFIYKFEKYLEIKASKVFLKFRRSKTSPIHFVIPILITLFTSFMKGGDVYLPFVAKIWDIVLVKNLEFMIFILFKLLKLQEIGILKMDNDKVLENLGKFEASPIVICDDEEKEGKFLELVNEGIFSKEKMLTGDLDIDVMEKLQFYLRHVRRVVKDFWEN